LGIPNNIKMPSFKLIINLHSAKRFNEIRRFLTPRSITYQEFLREVERILKEDYHSNLTIGYVDTESQSITLGGSEAEWKEALTHLMEPFRFFVKDTPLLQKSTSHPGPLLMSRHSTEKACSEQFEIPLPAQQQNKEPSQLEEEQKEEQCDEKKEILEEKKEEKEDFIDRMKRFFKGLFNDEKEEVQKKTEVILPPVTREPLCQEYVEREESTVQIQTAASIVQVEEPVSRRDDEMRKETEIMQLHAAIQSSQSRREKKKLPFFVCNAD